MKGENKWIEMSLTAADSTILFRRWLVGVEVGDDGFDLANGGTRESRRIEFGDGAERKRLFTLSLSMSRALQRWMIEYETMRNVFMLGKRREWHSLSVHLFEEEKEEEKRRKGKKDEDKRERQNKW